MTKTLLALVDGSSYSQSVCDHAAWIARRTNAHVDLMHVMGRRGNTSKTDLSGSIKLGARSALLKELSELDEQRAKLVAEHGRALLDDARDILVEAGVSDITTRLRHGDIIETVAEQEEHADMILVGKRGEAADFAKLHLGSNLERIIRASHKPVFVANRAFKPIEKVLVAFDGGASSLKAIDHISRDALYAGLDIHVVSVGAATPQTEKALENALAQLSAGGLTAQSHIVEGQPDKALAKMIEDHDFGILVMGAYGHSRIRRLIIGSTTSEMIRSCKVPIVLVR